MATELPCGLAPERMPRHIGIIMDGNGRWAKLRGQSRTAGHREGLKVTKQVVKHVASLGVPYLSLYTFSTENWKRAEEEVAFLMSLVENQLRSEYDFYVEHGIRVRFSGDMQRLPPKVQDALQRTMEDTASFTKLTVNLAINYGGRDEILRAMLRWKNAGSPAFEGECDFSSYLDNPDIPDPDLVLRTAGEQRLSNFLLWQSAYAEFWFTDTLWPDFGEHDLLAALLDYQRRTRKFGGITHDQC